MLTGEDFVSGDFWCYIKAGLIALCTSIVALVLGIGLSFVLPGVMAVALGMALAAVGLGFVITSFYGVDLKRSMIGAATYFALSITIRMFLSSIG